MKRIVLGLLAAASLVVPASGADLYIEPEVFDAVAAAQDWNGGYIGAFVGYGAGVADWDNGFGDVGIAGILAGLTAGYNFQNGNFVFGIEGDAAWSGIGGSVACPVVAFTCSTNVSWLSTLRGRVGYAVDFALLYATGGLAVGQVTSDTAPFTPGVVASSVHVGWTAGAGVEFAATEDLSIKAEYLYVNLGSRSDGGGVLGGGTTNVGVTAHTVKAGLNWHF